jgi:hypothetical protein
MPPRLVPAAILLLLGCGHTEPFSTPPSGTDQPFDPTPPVQLTRNLGADRSPTWLPDGSAILYATQELGRDDRDVCLAQLPPGGGRQTMLWCDVPAGPGWTDGLLSPAAAPDGRLAYHATSHTVNGLAPEINGLRVAASVDPFSGAVALRFPYQRSSASVAALGHLRWLGSDRLAFVAQSVWHRDLCPPCPQDTLVANVDIELLTLGPDAAPVPVPGTESASGLAALVENGDLLYTLDGDTRVYRRNLTSGSVQVVHDFGAAGIARDLHLSGNRLAVVVGGRVGGVVAPVLGPMQWDSGGVIHLLDLVSGADLPLEATGRIFRRPALSPAGDRVVAEGYVVTVTRRADPVTGQEVVDTAVSGGSDLYLFGGL